MSLRIYNKCSRRIYDTICDGTQYRLLFLSIPSSSSLKSILVWRPRPVFCSYMIEEMSCFVRLVLGIYRRGQTKTSGKTKWKLYPTCLASSIHVCLVGFLSLRVLRSKSDAWGSGDVGWKVVRLTWLRIVLNFRNACFSTWADKLRGSIVQERCTWNGQPYPSIGSEQWGLAVLFLCLFFETLVSFHVLKILRARSLK